MSKIALTPSATGTGVFTISSPATNTDRSLTLPDEAGTILTTATAGVPIGGPAFSAYLAGVQTVTTATFTKITFDTETFDTNNNFASSCFTPTVAGYYQINYSVGMLMTTSSLGTFLYKNGNAISNGSYVSGSANIGGAIVASNSALVYLNGSTDYVEVYVYQETGSSKTVLAALNATQFTGAMVRSAV